MELTTTLPVNATTITVKKSKHIPALVMASLAALWLFLPAMVFAVLALLGYCSYADELNRHLIQVGQIVWMLVVLVHCYSKLR